MRYSSIETCTTVLDFFGVNTRVGRTLDVGGTEHVWLKKGRQRPKRARNPLMDISPQIELLDKGYNVRALNTGTSMDVDFLDRATLDPLREQYDVTFSFDTLEHVPDPFTFCKHLAFVTKPGGFIYLSTVFAFPYHPSPEDYFRFTPQGLQSAFSDSAKYLTTVWTNWEPDGYGVAIFLYKGSDRTFPLLEYPPPPRLSRFKAVLDERYPSAAGALRSFLNVFR